MIQSQPSQSLLFLTALTSLLLIATKIQSCNSQRNNWSADCSNRDNYYTSYESLNTGFKVLDGLKAQTMYIDNNRIGVSQIPSAEY